MTSDASNEEQPTQAMPVEPVGEAPEPSVMIKFTGDDRLLELRGDDVDLGTDLKVRHQHRLIAEFRRDAVDGWWYKSAALNDGPPFGG